MHASDVLMFDSLCTTAFSSGDNQERSNAQEAIDKFGTQEYWQHNLALLQHSQNVYTLHFASKNLTRIFTHYHNSFSAQSRLEMCNTLLHVIARVADVFWATGQVRESIAEAFCRVQKLSWFELKNQGPVEGMLQQILPFLKHSMTHMIWGICLLQQLVYEMSNSVKGVSLAKQRKIATAFREECLLEIFKMGIGSLECVINSPPMEPERQQQPLLLSLCIKMLEQCLSFDFIGTTFDDSLDGLNLVYIPSSWEEYFSRSLPIEKIFIAYEKYPPPHSTQCLLVLELFAATRNSLFTSTESRVIFLNSLINGVGKILVEKKDFDDEENRHAMARVLLRLKTSFQLKYLQEAPNYPALMQQAAQFSLETIKTSVTFNTVFYILSFWNKMVNAHLLGSDTPTYVDEFAPTIANTFIETQLALVENTDVRDELLESEQLDSILEELQGVVQCNYVQMLVSMTNGLAALAHQLQSLLAQGNVNPEAVVQTESRLAWMVYFASSILRVPSRRIGRDDISEEDVLKLEAQLICVLFDYMGVHDSMLEQRGPSSKATQHLELAYIVFLQKFCKGYISDDAFATTKGLYEMLAVKFGMKTPMLVVDRVIKKVVLLLEKWPTHPTIVEKNLGQAGLFWSLANGWSASRLMSKSVVVQSLLKMHPSINPGEESQTHVAFYKTLGKLMFSTYNDAATFYQFVAPWQDRMAQFRTLLVCQQPKPVHQKFSQLCDDMRGLVASMQSKAGGYQMFFDWFYTEMGYFDWFLTLLSAPAILELEDVWGIVRFVTELSYNRQQRIQFEVTSAEGIKLFRSTAQLLLLFGTYIGSTQWTKIDNKYKSVCFYVKCLQRTLSGGYTNFGIFELYNDPILSNLLSQCFSLLFSLDMRELEMYPKISSQIYTALEVVTSHTEFVISLETTLFGQALRLLAKALYSNIPAIIAQACNSLDKLMSLHLSNLQKSQRQKIGAHTQRFLDAGKTHVETHRQLLTSIIIQLFNLIITGENVQWTVSRPLLSLILLLPHEFEGVASLIMSSQSADPEKTLKMTEQFKFLTEGIQMNITSNNREKFLSRVTRFQKDVKEFIDLNSFFKHILQFTKEAD